MKHGLAERAPVLAVIIAACWAPLAAAAPAATGSYPSKPIRLIVPQPPGGTVDMLARMIAQRLAESLRQQVVVDNRGGASGTIGSDLVAKAPADGYTVLMTMTSHTTTPRMLWCTGMAPTGKCGARFRPNRSSRMAQSWAVA